MAERKPQFRRVDRAVNARAQEPDLRYAMSSRHGVNAPVRMIVREGGHAGSIGKKLPQEMHLAGKCVDPKALRACLKGQRRPLVGSGRPSNAEVYASRRQEFEHSKLFGH